MKAAVFRGLGQPLSIETLADPVPGPGEVVLKVAACGICGSDLHATEEGAFLQAPGTVLGHEFAGEIATSNAPGWAVGTRATAVPVNPCGECEMCRQGRGILCPKNLITGLALDAPGAYAEYVKLPARHLVALPDAVSFEEGAMVEPLAVGLHAVDESGLSIGDRVLVIGAGPIGLSVTAFARAAGAGRVVVSERTGARRDAARDFGATDVIDPGAGPVAEAFADAAGGPPDIIFDCVGVPGLMRHCIDLSRPRGTVVVVGVCMKEDAFVPLMAILKELRVQYVLGYTGRDFGRVLDFLAQGRIDARRMLTDRVGLDELPAAFEALRRPDAQIKVMIAPGG